LEMHLSIHAKLALNIEYGMLGTLAVWLLEDLSSLSLYWNIKILRAGLCMCIHV
jgi:hypothetical protein